MNTELRRRVQILLHVVDEERVLGLQAELAQQMLVDPGLRLAKLQTARDHPALEHIPERVLALEVFDRREVHVGEAVERMALALQAIEELDGVGKYGERRRHRMQQ